MDWALEDRINHLFYTMQMINPVGSTVSITKHALLIIQTDLTIVGL
ncbi:unnamed protein product, partial [Staurois parvus]